MQERIGRELQFSIKFSFESIQWIRLLLHLPRSIGRPKANDNQRRLILFDLDQFRKFTFVCTNRYKFFRCDRFFFFENLLFLYILCKLICSIWSFRRSIFTNENKILIASPSHKMVNGFVLLELGEDAEQTKIKIVFSIRV